MNKFDKRHLANVRKYQRKIDAIYKKTAEEAARRAASLPVPDDYIFTFDDFPAVKKQIDALMAQMAADIELTVADGVRTEWDLANAKNDALVESVLGDAASLARYHRTHEEALNAFLGRKQNGLGLSDRVWRYTNQYKDEIEMGLDLGIREGKDAASIARSIQQYLKYPDMLFRRVKDEHGVFHLSKRAAAFHPGQGVYRSSYKNALRLAATETNIAYRTADHERWQDLDFIVGIEVHLSNNHTAINHKKQRVALFDICDELQGKYPKEFKFVGWHPNCRCIATQVFKTDKELAEDDERLKRGEEPLDPHDSENAVTEMPDGFNQWMEDNAERLENAKSMPYFVRDNFKDGDPSQGLRWMGGATQPTEKPLTALEVAEQRHAARTEEDVERIREAWYRRQTYQLMDDAREGLLPEASKRAIIEITDSLALGDLDDAQRRISMLQAASRRHAARTLDDIRRIQDMADVRRYGQEYVDHVHKLENQLGMKRGKRMTMDEADMQNANPYINKGKEYQINCATCTPTYVLRTMGFDVTAGANIAGTQVNYLSYGMHPWEVWMNADGTAAKYEAVNDWLAAKKGKQMTYIRWREFVNEKTAEPGIYGFDIGWKGGGGHMTVLERTEDGKLLYIEPQRDNSRKREDVPALLLRLSPNQHRVRGIMRIDDKLFNTKFISIFVKK